MRKFDTSKLISDKDILKGCLVLNDDYLDKVWDVYSKKYKNFSDKWKQDNWDAFEDDVCKRFEKIKKSALKNLQ